MPTGVWLGDAHPGRPPVRLEGLWDKCKDEPTAKGKPTTEATTKPTTKPTQEPKDTYYANCAEGPRGWCGSAAQNRPEYSTDLDRDGDGVACES